MTLTDPSGARLVDTRFGGGSELRRSRNESSFDRVVRTRDIRGRQSRRGARRRPSVRGAGADHPQPRAAICPDRNGQARGRSGGDRPARRARRLGHLVFDANGRRVARSRAHEENIGGEASPTLRALIADRGREGFGVTNTLEGERIYTPYSRIEPSGWSAALGIPTALVEAAGYRSLAVYGGGIALSIALGSLAALVGRQQHQPSDRRSARRRPGVGPPRVAPAAGHIHPGDSRRRGRAVAAAGERASVEADREALLRKEQNARAAAEAADRAKDQFLAVLSHELRTPLNAVYGWARMLRPGRSGRAQVARALEVIERNANAQVQLVDDLLDVSRIITGKMRLDVRRSSWRGVMRGGARTPSGRPPRPRAFACRACSIRGPARSRAIRTGSSRSCGTCSSTR